VKQSAMRASPWASPDHGPAVTAAVSVGARSYSSTAGLQGHRRRTGELAGFHKHRDQQQKSLRQRNLRHDLSS
jgi:hypothetical protein